MARYKIRSNQRELISTSAIISVLKPDLFPFRRSQGRALNKVSGNPTPGALMGFEAGKFSYEAVFDWFPLLKERQFQPTGTLSGGEQKMLSIGRVLVENPSLLLLDQPSEGLQPSIVELIADVIWRQMEEKGVTVLLGK